MNDKYILDAEGNPKPEPDLIKWGRWMQSSERHVAQDYVADVRVSTVFLGLDHSFSFFEGDDGPPVLWETMIFGGEHDMYQERYTSREAAIAGHQKALEVVRGDTSAV